MTSRESRDRFGFVEKARRHFGFLNSLGYSEIQALPTLVRFRKDGVEVDVHHGRHSYELDVGVSYSGKRYALTEIIRAVAPGVGVQHIELTASTDEGVEAGLEKLQRLTVEYAVDALRGDSQFFASLAEKQKLWSDEYWLNILASQIRPLAETAFRKGDYVKTVELYSRIQSCLSPGETKKLDFARARLN